jgi:ABC-type uncharacterized transport system YnjBCD ATPase subunit
MSDFVHAETVQYPGGSISSSTTITATGGIQPINNEPVETGALTRLMTSVPISGLKAIVLSSTQEATLTPNVKHIETLTVLGTIGASGAGNAEVVVTAVGMANSPKTLSVAVANDDTATQVAGKIRTALIADDDVDAFFDVTGAGANVVLTTRNPVAADATRNISVDNDTCSGLTTVPTSTGTLSAGGTPIVLQANKPYVWLTGGYNDLVAAFANNVFSWDVLQSSGSQALINQQGLADPTP